MNEYSSSMIQGLMEKGVMIPNPGSVEIGRDVDIEKISGSGVRLYSGSKIYGHATCIGRNVRIGYEGSVTIENCQIGDDVRLRSGVFKESVFLEGSDMGPGSHVREGTILEEYSKIAHTVGLKQTILFPYVTLGSLINFCDCLMAGGKGSKNHSEVGSSYIHFNFTTSQDKATPSLIGDVPRGVMMNQAPIFLGGQGGLVGPTRLEFGTVTAAGTICRKDELRPNRLILEGRSRGGSVPYFAGKNQNIGRITENNIIYIGNLIALKTWYTSVRSLFISHRFPEPLFNGLVQKTEMGINERIKRLQHFYEKLVEEDKRKYSDIKNWHELRGWVSEYDPDHRKHRVDADEMNMELFLEDIRKGIERFGKDYLAVIKDLSTQVSETGTRWLQSVVDHFVEETMKVLSGEN